jgi:hypothetical protein
VKKDEAAEEKYRQSHPSILTKFTFRRSTREAISTQTIAASIGWSLGNTGTRRFFQTNHPQVSSSQFEVQEKIKSADREELF